MINGSSGYNREFEQARKLHAAGRLDEAETAYKRLLSTGEHREDLLRALVELYMQGGRLNETIETLEALTIEVPGRLYYYARLAALLDGMGQTDAAIGHYQHLLERQPELADAHFNLALLYKNVKRYTDALSSYEAAIRFGIENVQEVYSNMGVLYTDIRQKEKAMEMYNNALEIDSGYVPALFNLAGLYEESGQGQQAFDLYQRILAIDPRHWDSLARLAYLKKVTADDGKLIESLRQAADDTGDDQLAREGLLFALGKSLDDLGLYDQAFNTYHAANELGRQRFPRYDRAQVEQFFERLMEIFTPGFVERRITNIKAAPVFICGMFRSGSTLLEQILAGHPGITAGGELDFLPWLVASRLAPYPEKVTNTPLPELVDLGEEYLSLTETLFPGAGMITDKRPDNFLYLGLIKLLFPAARIIYTKRHPIDNCLSVYFQQFGGNLSYSADLEDTAHYYLQHEVLMKHWVKCFKENVFTVEYDELVAGPEPILRSLLEFLGLEWSDRCLEFQNADTLVKTASVWQVREGLHMGSAGRWKNYSAYVEKIRGQFT